MMAIFASGPQRRPRRVLCGTTSSFASLQLWCFGLLSARCSLQESCARARSRLRRPRVLPPHAVTATKREDVLEVDPMRRELIEVLSELQLLHEALKSRITVATSTAGLFDRFCESSEVQVFHFEGYGDCAPSARHVLEFCEATCLCWQPWRRQSHSHPCKRSDCFGTTHGDQGSREQ